MHVHFYRVSPDTDKLRNCWVRARGCGGGKKVTDEATEKIIIRSPGRKCAASGVCRCASVQSLCSFPSSALRSPFSSAMSSAAPAVAQSAFQRFLNHPAGMALISLGAHCKGSAF